MKCLFLWYVYYATACLGPDIFALWYERGDNHMMLSQIILNTPPVKNLDVTQCWSNVAGDEPTLDHLWVDILSSRVQTEKLVTWSRFTVTRLRRRPY